MKKTKFILPVIGVGTIASAIVPLATSCGNKGYTLNWEKGDEVPEIKPYEGEPGLTTTKATDLYFDQIKNDKEFLANEIINDLTRLYGDALKDATITTKVDTKKHIVSYTSHTTFTVGEEDYVYNVEAKNTEFSVDHNYASYYNPLYYVGEGTEFAPTILLEVSDAYYAGWAVEYGTLSVDVYNAKVKKALDHAEKLAQDTKWYFQEEETSLVFGPDSKITTRIDSTNIYEYVELIFYSETDISWSTLENYAIISSYFARGTRYVERAYELI